MINLAAPGTPGSKGHPMTVGQLEKMISDSVGGAEVKVKGFTELSPTEVATMESEKLRQLTGNTERHAGGLRINHALKDNMTQSLKDINRTPKKIFEDRGRGLFLALDQDDELWVLDGSTWFQIKEPGFPDLPKKEITSS